MKVMILVPGLPLNIDDIKGGVHSAVINLLTGFQKKDIIVRLVSLNDDIKENTNLQFSKNIDIVYLNEGTYPFHSFNYFINGPSLIKKEIKKFNPDIIHFEEGNSFLLTKFFGLHKKPYLLTMHGMAFAESRAQKKISDKINLYFNGIIQSGFHPANIIHLSEYSLNLHPFSKKSQCCIISNAVNLSFFNVPPKKSMDNSLLYIGVINERKNLKFLLEALKNLLLQNIQYSLTVIGGFADDLYKQKVLNYIKENNLYKTTNAKISDFKKFASFCAQILFDKKAIAVKGYDIEKISSTCDIALIASGTSTRHASSMAENLVRAVKDEFNLYPLGIEGVDEGRWVVVDYGALIVHVFYDFVRQEYRLEDLWKEGAELKLADQSAKATLS